jgi:hypothetical protein
VNRKVLVVLAGVAGVLVVLAAVLTPRAGNAPTGGDPTALFPDLAARADAVSTLRIVKGAQSATLEKRGAEWVVTDKGGYPATAGSVRAAIRALIDASIIEPKTSKPEMYPRLGVEDPAGEGATSTLMELKDATGAVVAGVIIGKRQWGAGPAADEQSVYVRRAGEARSFQVKGELRADADPMMWIDRQVSDIGQDRVNAVTIRHGIPDGVVPPAVVRLTRAATEGREWVLEDKPADRPLKDEFVLTRVAGALAGLTLEDVGPAGSVDTSAADAVAAEFTGDDGVVVTLSSVMKDDKAWATLRASVAAGIEDAAKREAAEKQAAGLNAKWEAWVYQVPKWKADVLRSKAEDLLGAAPGLSSSGGVPVTPDQPPPGPVSDPD